MKGFDIWINDKKLSVAIIRGATVVAIEKKFISISGIDNSSGARVDWGKFALNIGDKVKIITAEIDENTVPINVCSIDRQELIVHYQNTRELLIKEGALKW